MAEEGINLAKAFVQIVPTTKDIKKNIESLFNAENVDSVGSKSGSDIGKKLVSTIKGVIAAAGIAKAVGSALHEGSAIEQSIGGVQTLFKDASDKLVANAQQAFKTAGVSANTYMEQSTMMAAALVSSLGGDTNKAADVANTAIIDMSDNANKMGTDIQMIQNAYSGFSRGNYTMLDNLKLGFAGTKEGMQSLLDKANEINKQNGKDTDYQIQNYSDIVNAIHDVQVAMDITGTTQREGATTFEGSMNMMKASFTDLLGTIATGGNVSQAVGNFVTSATTFLVGNAFPMILNVISGFVTAIPSVIEAILTQALPSATASLSGLLDSILAFMTTDLPPKLEYFASPEFWASFDDKLHSYFTGDALTGILSTIGQILVSAAGAIGQGIPLLLQAVISIVADILEALINAWPDILHAGVDMIVNFANGFMQGLPNLLDRLGVILSNLLTAIINKWPECADAGIKLIGGLASGIIQNGPAIIAAIGRLIWTLLQAIWNNLPALGNAGIKIVSVIANGLGSALGAIGNAAWGLINTVWNTITNINWLGLGKNIVWGIINGLGSLSYQLGRAVINLANKIWGGIKRFFGINSPSKLMTWAGRMIDQGAIEGINADADDVGFAMTDMARKSMEGYNAGLNTKALNATHRLVSSVSVTSSADRMDEMNTLMKKLIAIEEAGSNKQVYLDSNKLVGHLAPAMDDALGRRTGR